MNSDLQTLHDSTLAVLKRTGVKVDSRQALECLAGQGVRVDGATMRVYPDMRHVEEALATVPRRLTIHGRRPDRDRPVILGGDDVSVLSGGGSLRDEAWEPWAFDRDNFAAWDKAGRVSVVARASAKAREILATHRPEPLPADMAVAILALV